MVCFFTLKIVFGEHSITSDLEELFKSVTLFSQKCDFYDFSFFVVHFFAAATYALEQL